MHVPVKSGFDYLVGTAFGKIQKNNASHKDEDKKSARQCP